jgi:hypothetical protein
MSKKHSWCQMRRRTWVSRGFSPYVSPSRWSPKSIVSRSKYYHDSRSLTHAFCHADSSSEQHGVSPGNFSPTERDLVMLEMLLSREQRNPPCT